MNEKGNEVRIACGNVASKETTGIKKFFSIFLALLPIIAIYSSGIPGFNIADIILLFFLAASILLGKKASRRIDSRLVIMILYCAYICTLPLLIGAVGSGTAFVDIIIRTVRIIFYIVSATFLSMRHLDINVFKKSVIRVSLAGVVYIAIQYILYYVFNYYLAGYLPFLEVYQAGYEGVDYLSRFEMQFFRPTSFFLEPAHCSRYLILGLIFVLFKRRMRKRDSFFAIIIAMGILLTTSGQGYLMVAIVLVCFVFFNPYKRFSAKNIGRMLAILIFASAVVLLLYFSTDIIQNTISRMFNDTSTGAFTARLGTLFEILDEEPLYLILGHGYGAVPYENAWMSGITYVLYGSGFIGLLLLFVFFINAITVRKTINRTVALIFFFLFFVDDAFNSYMTVIYLSTILYYVEDGREKRIVYRNRN